MLLYHCIDDFWVRLRTFLPSSRVIRRSLFVAFFPTVKIAIFQEYFFLFGSRICPFIDFIGFVYRGSKPCAIKMSFLGSTVFRLAILDLLQILIAFRNHFYQKRVQIFFFFTIICYTLIFASFFSHGRATICKDNFIQRNVTKQTWHKFVGALNDGAS